MEKGGSGASDPDLQTHISHSFFMMILRPILDRGVGEPKPDIQTDIFHSFFMITMMITVLQFLFLNPISIHIYLAGRVNSNSQNS